MTTKFDAVIGTTEDMVHAMFPGLEEREAALKVKRAMWLEQRTAEYNARALHLVTLAVQGKLSPREAVMSEDQYTDLSVMPTGAKRPAGASPTTLVEALARAQGVIPNAKFDRKNPHFKSAYASLPSVRDAAQKPLCDNTIAITQTMEERNGHMWLLTTLRGYGETIESVYPLPSADFAAKEPQKFGSALTYARRYSASALLFMASDEDDDANLAQASGNGKAAEEIITPAQVETLQLELAEVVAKDADYLPSLLEWADISTIQHLQAARYDYVLGQIKAKKRKLAKPEVKS